MRLLYVTTCSHIVSAQRTASLSARDVEAEVEDRRAVGDPAAREQVDAGCGDDRCGFEGNPPGGFGDGAAVDHRHRPAQRLWIHVVEEYGVDPDFEPLGELVEGVDLELDFDEMPGMLPRSFERLAHPACERNMVVLNQHRVVEPEAVVGAAAKADRVLFECAQARRGL